MRNWVATKIAVLQRFWFLWFLAFCLSATLLSWNSIVSNLRSQVTQNEPPELGFFGFLDRNLLVIKQRLELTLFPHRFIPSSDIVILSLEYPDRGDFWLDEETKSSLGKHLRDYQGIILTNIEGGRLSRDPSLNSVLENPQFIRGVSFGFGFPSKEGPESFISRNIIEDNRPSAGKLIGILPQDPRYYQSGRSYGLSMLGVDLYSHFIFSFPLFLRGSSHLIPTNVSAAYMRSLDVERVELTDSLSLKFFSESQNESNPITWPVWLPLKFYGTDFLRISSVDQLPLDSDKILIVEIKDQWGSLRNLFQERVSWGTIAATALSNLKLKDALIPSPVGSTVLLILCLLGVFVIVVGSTTRLRTALICVFCALVGLFFADLVLSLGFGFRTHPLEEAFVLLIMAFVGIGTRAALDIEERQMFERALSGYVSEQRLKRLIDGKEKLHLEGREIIVTTMIFDIVGFSKISKEIGPEATFSLIQKIFAQTDPVVFHYGGVIDKQTGDGFLAFFGDEDDAGSESNDKIADASLRACLCALEIQKSLLHSPILTNSKASPFICARIGVNTGRVMIGNAGSELHFNYTVFGESVNFTQRLEAACKPGKVLIGEQTHAYAHEKIVAIPQQISVKGEQNTSVAYELSSK
jgi:class 3 adenylate cyclase